MGMKALVLSVAFVGCLISAPAPINNPADCDRAGAVLASLSCSANGRPLWVTPKGTPFAAVCRSAAIPYHPADVAKVTDCNQVDSAFRGAKE